MPRVVALLVLCLHSPSCAELFHGGHEAVHIMALEPPKAQVEHANRVWRNGQHSARRKRNDVETTAALDVGDPTVDTHSGEQAIPARLPRHPGKVSLKPRPAAFGEVGEDGLSEEKEQEIKDMTTELTDCRSEYTGVIGVGTDREGAPLVKARVVFDTGSTNLWVISNLCEVDCDPEQRRTYFDPHASFTHEEPPLSGDVDILFGTGEIVGPLARDVIQVGPVRVRSQPFGLIRNMTGSVFRSFTFEGILGLGFKSLSLEGMDSFIDRIVRQKVLGNNEFSFFLNPDSSKPSAILWGGVDHDLFEGSIRMFNVSKPHYWSLELLDFHVGNESVLDGVSDRPTQLVVDSGTTFFTAPESLMKSIVKHLPHAPCRDVADHPDLTYVLQTPQGDPFNLVVSQETYMIGSDNAECEPAFMALDVNPKWGPAMILGEVFMRHFFTTFSRGDGEPENAKIGFAPVKPGASPRLNGKDELPHIEDDKLLESLPLGVGRTDHSKNVLMRREIV